MTSSDTVDAPERLADQIELTMRRPCSARRRCPQPRQPRWAIRAIALSWGAPAGHGDALASARVHVFDGSPPGLRAWKDCATAAAETTSWNIRRFAACQGISEAPPAPPGLRDYRSGRLVGILASWRGGGKNLAVRLHTTRQRHWHGCHAFCSWMVDGAPASRGKPAAARVGSTAKPTRPQPAGFRRSTGAERSPHTASTASAPIRFQTGGEADGMTARFLPPEHPPAAQHVSVIDHLITAAASVLLRQTSLKGGSADPGEASEVVPARSFTHRNTAGITAGRSCAPAPRALPACWRVSARGSLPVTRIRHHRPDRHEVSGSVVLGDINSESQRRSLIVDCVPGLQTGPAHDRAAEIIARTMNVRGSAPTWMKAKINTPERTEKHWSSAATEKDEVRYGCQR